MKSKEKEHVSPSSLGLITAGAVSPFSSPSVMAVGKHGTADMPQDLSKAPESPRLSMEVKCPGSTLRPLVIKQLIMLC